MRKEAGQRCLAAFDIGTTTIAGYLLDGADVIMRANYGLEHGTEALSMCVRD